MKIHHHHHHHLPPWIRSFDLFRHRRIAIVSWGVQDLFFLEVCSWGRFFSRFFSGVWCCPFFQGGWSSFVCIWVSRLVFQRSLVLFLSLRFLFHLVLCIPLTLLRKRISAASRRVMSLFVVTHVSLPYSSDGLATTLWNFVCVSVRGFFKRFLTVPHISIRKYIML